MLFYLFDLRLLFESVAVRKLLKRVTRVRLTFFFFVLKVTIEYKVAEMKNVDFDLFVVQYLSPEEIISAIALHVLLVS